MKSKKYISVQEFDRYIQRDFERYDSMIMSEIAKDIMAKLLYMNLQMISSFGMEIYLKAQNIPEVYNEKEISSLAESLNNRMRNEKRNKKTK